MAAPVTVPVRAKSLPMSEKYYTEALEMAASFNSKLCADTKQRQPFLDSQTGVAQSHSNIWFKYRYRRPGEGPGQLYSYPAKRWKKKKRPFQAPDVKLSKAGDVETGESDMHFISAIENTAVQVGEDSREATVHVEQKLEEKIWYEEYDQLSEPLDAGEIEDKNSEDSDYEETYVKKKKVKPKKSKGGPGRGRKSNAASVDKEVYDEKEKPYSCETCGARYKTRPGLTYHLNHFHQKDEEEEYAPSPSTSVTQTNSNDGETRRTRATKDGKPNPNNYCDFCLGDQTENKKTGEKEDLVSCADCGRSGHPSCLQFTPNMIISVKKYPWQCIECKSCGLCGTSDNDDQLLFCDDCDRGYHMYCLNPPLTEPPEGSWSCHLCIAEFYDGKKPPGME